MKEKHILRILGQVDDKYIEEATPGKYVDGNTATFHTLKLRRTLRTSLIAAILSIIMLLGSFTVAMAVNEEFREAVFQFLGIEQTEVVPEHETDHVLTPDDMVVDNIKTDIGGMIEGLLSI